MRTSRPAVLSFNNIMNKTNSVVRICALACSTALLLGTMACFGGTRSNSNQEPSAAGTPEHKPEGQAELKLPPVDEADRDPSFVAFRAKLLEAIEKKDAAFVLSILDRSIINSFGGNGGIEEFKEQWKLDQPDSELWAELKTILSLGGSFVRDSGETIQFCAPYVFSTWDRVEGKVPELNDAPTYGAIIGDNIALRREPRDDSDAIATLAYDVVTVLYEKSIAEKDKEGQFTWLNVATMDGKQGFVKQNEFRGPLEYRACFTKTGNGWKMTVLVAGD
jgi:hypothetical protein